MDDAGLDDLLAGVRAVSGEGSPPAEQLAAALRQYRQPVTIQVAGRAGAGKSAVTVALGLPPAAEQPAITGDSAVPDGDLVIYVLPGGWDSTDKRILGELTPASGLAVLNTSDTGPTVAAALEVSARATEELGVQTFPLACWLAAQAQHDGVDETELRAFRALAAIRNPLLTLSPDLFTAAPGPEDAGVRAALLGRWDFTGVCTVMHALYRDPALSARSLDQILYNTSGLTQLRAALTQRAAQLQALRGGELLAELAALAARSGAAVRDQIESFQRGAVAAELSLEAGLAHPALAGHAAAAGQRGGADLLQYWSTVAGDGQLSPAARRSALRVHHAYGWQLSQEAPADA